MRAPLVACRELSPRHIAKAAIWFQNVERKT